MVRSQDYGAECRRCHIGRASLARENEVGDIWGQEAHNLSMLTYSLLY